MVVEVLNPQAEPRDSDLLNDAQFSFGEGTGLGFKRDFLGFIPRQEFLHGGGQLCELARRNIGGSAAAEVDELGFAAADEGPLGVELKLPDGGVEVALDLARVLVGIDLEVAERAALATKRNMQVDTYGSAGGRPSIEGGIGFVDAVPSPERVGRVVGNEVISGPCVAV